MQTVLERAASYLERMPPAIAGSGGHTATFNAAVALTRGFDISVEQALPLLLAWNQTHCHPHWTETDLLHKLRSAAATSTRSPGYLIGENSETLQKPCKASEGYRKLAVGADSKNLRKPCGTSPAANAEKKAGQRQEWPEFKPLKPAGIAAIARLRHLPPAAVHLARHSGFLKGAEIEGHRCFIIHEGTFAQARRLDGEPFTRGDGTQIKAKNLPGSEGAFIGAQWLGGPEVNVLLVEGAVALLEALAAHEIVCPAEGWTILAATSASSRFARDPDLLARLRGRRVRIIPDADEAGQNAAASWLADLEAAGARVDAVALPDGIKDLGEIITESDAHRETLNAVFQ